MASTVISSKLVVSISEKITLNDQSYGGKNTCVIPGITDIDKRIVTVPTSEIEILKMDTSAGAGQFIEGDVRYIRITNLDDTNNGFLTFKNEDDDEFCVLLDYGQSFIYNSNFDGGVVNTFDANAGAASIHNLGDLVNITAQADTAAIDLEIFVASV